MDFHWNLIEIPIEFQLDLKMVLHLYFIGILTGFFMAFHWNFIEISTGFQIDFNWYFFENSAGISLKFKLYVQ